MYIAFSKPKKIIFLLFVILTAYFQCFAQKKLDEVQTQNIEYKRVVEFLDHQKTINIVTFGEIKPTLPPDSSTIGFHVIDREYLYKDKLENVWNHYVNAGLQNSWNTKKIHLGFTYSGKDDSLYYAADTIKSLIPGLIVFFDIDLLFGIKDIAMAFEVTRIDSVKKIIEYSYIVGNGSEGKQQMFFENTPKGNTLITHLTYYKSKPKTREGIYPHIHAQLINRYHRNMKRMYNEKE